MKYISLHTIITVLLLALTLLALGCTGEDVIGKVAIEYSGDWDAEIVENGNIALVGGTGDWENSYENPDTLKVTVTKLDSTERKLTLYIYEDGRIVAGDSTRAPGGSVTAEYEFPY
jgi:hypothetical protein